MSKESVEPGNGTIERGRRELLKTGEGIRRDERGGMRALAMTAVSLAALAVVAVHAKALPPAVTVTHKGDQPSIKASAQYFTGSVRIEPLFLDAKAPSRVTAATVTLEPGARTAWHSPPLGQHLIVTDGIGWVQQEGGERQPIKPGDVVWIPPGMKHWHGATALDGMTHIAIQEALDGNNVTWMEHVSDEHY